jgi:transposase
MKHRQFNLTKEAIQALEAAERETRDALALRRLQGVRMYGSGLDMKLVPQVTGATRRTVDDWVKAYGTHGVVGLKPGWKGGNSRKLTV